MFEFYCYQCGARLEEGARMDGEDLVCWKVCPICGYSTLDERFKWSDLLTELLKEQGVDLSE